MVRERDPAPLETATAEDPANLSEEELLEGNRSGAMRDDLPEDAQVPLFPVQEADDLRKRWEMVQADFVDEPRRAVRERG